MTDEPQAQTRSVASVPELGISFASEAMIEDPQPTMQAPAAYWTSVEHQTRPRPAPVAHLAGHAWIKRGVSDDLSTPENEDVLAERKADFFRQWAKSHRAAFPTAPSRWPSTPLPAPSQSFAPLKLQGKVNVQPRVPG